MTWRSTAVYWLLFVVLAAFYATVEQRPEPPSEAKLARKKVFDAFAEDVQAVVLRGGGKEVRAERKDKRWTVVKPEGAKAAPDLIATLVENLTEKQEAEEMDSTPSAEDIKGYGLTDDAIVVELEMKDGKKVSIKLGARNPPQTAIYAQSSITPRVLLIGLNVQYYTDLLFETTSKTAAASPEKAPAKTAPPAAAKK